MRTRALWPCGVLLLVAAWAGADEKMCPTKEQAAPAGGTAEVASPPGPVRVRDFAPMRISVVPLREKVGPVYFRSLLADPSPADRRIDRCPPLAAGAAVADWFLFAGRVLGFPIEMVLRPPWQTERPPK